MDFLSDGGRGREIKEFERVVLSLSFDLGERSEERNQEANRQRWKLHSVGFKEVKEGGRWNIRLRRRYKAKTERRATTDLFALSSATRGEEEARWGLGKEFERTPKRSRGCQW